MANAKVTKRFRIQEDDGQKSYFPGMVAKGKTGDWAIKNGFGEKLTKAQEAELANKAEPAPANKSA